MKWVKRSTLLAGILCFCRIGEAQIIDNYGGGGTLLGDEGPALSAKIVGPYGGGFDTAGNFYFGQTFGSPRIRRIDNAGIIHAVAGNGMVGFSGDGGIATAAKFNQINGVAVDRAGNVFISDLQNYRIRRVDAASNIITTIAGTGINGFGGDGGPAINALVAPASLCVDTIGNIYFMDKSERIRKIDIAGVITTIAGNGTLGYSGDNGPATSAELNISNSICLDNNGNLLIGCTGRIRKIDLSSGIITTIAGTGVVDFNGDGIIADTANFGDFGICIDTEGNLYIADYPNHRVRKIDTQGTIHTVAGNGVQGYSGDNGQAIIAQINHPEGVAVDRCGNLYVADEGNNRIRKVTFNPNCSITDTTIVDTTDTSTAVQNILHKDNDVHIYPNPAKENVTVNYSSSAAEISIVNMLGQTLLKEKVSGHKAVLNVAGLNNGVYFIVVKDERDNCKRIKFVKE